MFSSRSACFFDFRAIPGFTEGSHTAALIFTVNDWGSSHEAHEDVVVHVVPSTGRSKPKAVVGQ